MKTVVETDAQVHAVMTVDCSIQSDALLIECIHNYPIIPNFIDVGKLNQLMLSNFPTASKART